MDGYSLSREFWDFAFENPEKVKPTHIAIYFFAVEHCNRLGWKEKFGLPTAMVLDAVGIKSYSVYKKCFDDLTQWGFFEVLEYSKNQYSANVIALKENVKANVKALDKAFVKHVSKQLESTCQSTESINKQLTIKPLNQQQSKIVENNEDAKYLEVKNKILDYQTRSLESPSWIEDMESKHKIPQNKLPIALNDFVTSNYSKQKHYNNIHEFKTHFIHWIGSIRDIKSKKANQ